MPPPTNPAAERSKVHGALAAASRVRILGLLRNRGTPLDVQQIAERTGLHLNTVRFHLKVLVDAGLACCRPDSRGASGRPRLVYVAVTDVSGDRHPDGFRLLADILAGYLATNSEVATGLAEEAGRAFARRHHRPGRLLTTVAADEAVRRVVAMFAELGFEPQPTKDGAHYRVLLHACPFHAIAKAHPEVVCATHLGLLKQSLANFGSSVEVIGLEPFVTPHLCIAHLAETGRTPTERQAQS